MPTALPKPETTLALIFGASKWPDCKRFEPLPAVDASSDAIYEMLRRADGLGLPQRNVKNLFGSFEDAAEQLSQAHSFIEQRRREISERGSRLTDLIIYYAGHGDFEGEAHDFYLTVRRTHSNHPMLTSITARELGNWVRQNAFDLRTYLVIDCCFAAAVQYGFMTSPLGLAELKLHQALPGSESFRPLEGLASAGVALLAASGFNTPAIASPDEIFTRFTAALLNVLSEGHPHLPEYLSLSDLHSLLSARIRAAYPDGARPELRSLQQTHGRVELVGLFPNAARLQQRAERERSEQESRGGADQARPVEEVRQHAEQARLAERQHQQEEDERAIDEARAKEAQEQAQKAEAEVAGRLAEAAAHRTGEEEISDALIPSKIEDLQIGKDALHEEPKGDGEPTRTRFMELKDLGLLAVLVFFIAGPYIWLNTGDRRVVQDTSGATEYSVDNGANSSQERKFETVKELLRFRSDGDEQKWRPDTCDNVIEYRLQMIHQGMFWWEMPNILPEETVTAVNGNSFTTKDSNGTYVKYLFYNNSLSTLHRAVGTNPAIILVRCSD